MGRRVGNFKKLVIFCLTLEPHDTVVAALEEQLIYDEGGRDGLWSRGVDFWTIILKTTSTDGIITNPVFLLQKKITSQKHKDCCG